MRHLLFTVFLYLTSFILKAQSGSDIIAALKAINQSVVNKPCGAANTGAVANRAMNIFLADKSAYLSASRDLSFYTNYITFNSAEGKFTVNHNFQQAAGTDKQIRKLLSFGFDMTVAGSYAKSFLDKRFENEIGITINYKWLDKVKTRFADCSPVQNNTNQKQAMDALRAAMVEQLQIEIIKKEADFNLVLQAIDSATVPGQDITTAKKLVQQNFYTGMKLLYEEKFALNQAALLTQTGNFKLIRTGWTSLTAYIPVLFPKYVVATSLAAPLRDKHPYPLSIMLSHTRLWESAKTGRLFFTLEAGLLFNNSKLSYGLNKLGINEYKSLGGTDTLHAAAQGNNKVYTGMYKTFLAPLFAARIVYFPPEAHVGISVLAEKSFNDYNVLNCRLGIPVVLINRKKTPAVNVECYVLFFDVGDKIPATGKTAAGLAIGIPFSRLMY